MKNINLFKKAVKLHRKDLLAAGYSKATIYTWQCGSRLPMYRTALKLQAIIGLDISEIPFYRIERNL